MYEGMQVVVFFFLSAFCLLHDERINELINHQGIDYKQLIQL